jgi:hypothetical protein
MTGLEKVRFKLENFIKANISGSEIRSKKESKMMNFLSKVLFFNKRFMTGYVTTWYPHIYVPKLPWRENNHAPAIATHGLGFQFFIYDASVLFYLWIAGFLESMVSFILFVFASDPFSGKSMG